MFARLKQNGYFIFELLLSFRIIALLGPNLSINLLIQDKICLVEYHQSRSFCQNIQLKMNTSAEKAVKDDILAYTTRFLSYKQIIETVPILIWSLFLGPFLDKYPNSSFVLFVVNLLGDIFLCVVYAFGIYFYDSSPYFLLIGSLNIWFTGGMMSFGTAAGVFITNSSDEKTRSLKFVALEIIIILGLAFALFIGGQFLRPSNSGPQLRTYQYNFIMTLVLDVLCFVLIYLLFKVEKGRKEAAEKAKSIEADTESTYSSKDESDIAKCLDANNNNTDSTVEVARCDSVAANQDTETEHVKPNPFAVFFDLNSVRQTVHCFFKPRPNNVRLQILLLSFISFTQLLVTNGLSTLMTQFSQKVYQWSPTTYSMYASISLVASMLLLAVASGIFVKLLKFDDDLLMLIAQVSNFFADVVRGTFLSQIAFFVSIPVGCLGGFGIVATKSKFSKIIPIEDVGKVFSLSSTIEALVPIAANLIYSNIFALSISTYPGLIYHFSCVLMILTIGVLTIEQRFCPVKGQDNRGAHV